MPPLNYAALFGASAVIAGAFGAHGLKGRGFDDNLVKAWATAAK